MHTLEIKLRDGSVARVIHDSDFSGPVLVQWIDDGKHKEERLPGAVLLAIGHASAHKAITDKLISALEQMKPAEATPEKPRAQRSGMVTTKLTKAQMQAGWDAWTKAKNSLPMFDDAVQAAFFCAAKTDMERPGDSEALFAAMNAVDVPEERR